MGKDCTSCSKNGKDGNDLDIGNKRSISKKNKKLHIDSMINNNEMLSNGSKQQQQESTVSFETTLRYTDGIHQSDMNISKQNNGQSVEGLDFLKSAETQKDIDNGATAAPGQVSRVHNQEIISQSVKDKKFKALDIEENDKSKSIMEKSFDAAHGRDIKGVGSDGFSSGYIPSGTIKGGQQATDSQRHAGDIEQESELTHMEANESKQSQSIQDRVAANNDLQESSMVMKPQKKDSEAQDQYDVEILPQKEDKVYNPEQNAAQQANIFQSSQGNEEYDDLDDCQMLHGSIIEDPDEKLVQNSLKKVNSQVNRAQRKQTLQIFNKKKELVDDASSEGSYMVRLPGAKPQMQDDMQSQSSYMVKAPDNNQPVPFDQSSMADSSVMMKGGASDIFDGQSVVDSEQQFMRKNSKPIDAMSAAESTELGQGDQENQKVFDDVTSNGTFMGKGGAVVKTMDDNSF